MKKLIALTMAVLMMVSLVACGSADSGNANSDAAYSIGVCQLVQHVAHCGCGVERCEERRNVP